MTEQEKMQTNIEENVNAAVDHVTEAAEAAVSLGRQVTALWLGVSRTAIEAAAKTLTSTSEMISTFANSMGELSERIDDAAKKA
jgi:DNA-binding ferritin-like protein